MQHFSLIEFPTFFQMQESHLMDFKLKCYSINLQEVIYKKRTQESQIDGCAIFFNSNLMELVDEERVEYFQPNVDVNQFFLV